MAAPWAEQGGGVPRFFLTSRPTGCCWSGTRRGHSRCEGWSWNWCLPVSSDLWTFGLDSSHEGQSSQVFCQTAGTFWFSWCNHVHSYILQRHALFLYIRVMCLVYASLWCILSDVSLVHIVRCQFVLLTGGGGGVSHIYVPSDCCLISFLIGWLVRDIFYIQCAVDRTYTQRGYRSVAWDRRSPLNVSRFDS